jgi:hypothetical protein
VSDVVDENLIIFEAMDQSRFMKPNTLLEYNFYYLAEGGYLAASQYKPVWLKQIQSWEVPDNGHVIFLDYVGNTISDNKLYYCNVRFWVL